MHSPVSFRYIYPIFLGSQALNDFIFRSRSCLESGSSSLVESPKHQLGTRRGARTKGKSEQNKIPTPHTNLTSGYELCPPPVRRLVCCRMLFSLKKRGERDEARRGENPSDNIGIKPIAPMNSHARRLSL